MLVLTDLIFMLLGRLSLFFDILRRLLGAKRQLKSQSMYKDELDRTGIVVDKPKPLIIGWEDSDIFFPLYPFMSHSLWRAQEFSLFRSHWNVLNSPILDFGCGDGSFASAFSKQIEYGVDIDEDALKVAEKYNIYSQLVLAGQEKIPLQQESVGSIFSNSVLEHVTNLTQILSEFHRLLQTNGCLTFSVPVVQYERDLTKYFGKRTARQINLRSFHRNLYEPHDWEKLLNDNGFSVEKIIHFQPARFTFWFYMCRLFGKRGLTMFISNINEIVWQKFKTHWIALVKNSVLSTQNGGNIFVVARKK